MFSGFYIALLLILFCLIVRVVSFEWRSKGESPRWRRVWLWANAVGSFGAPFLWGIALANLLHGVPLNSSGDFAGKFADLFSWYTVFAGIALVLLFALHGAGYLTLRTTGELCERASRTARALAVPAAVVAAGFVAWTVAVAHDRNDKGVLGPAIPAVIAAGALALAVVLVRMRRHGWAFGMTALGIISAVATLFTGLYPRVMVSSPNFANSLTVASTASAHYTLEVLTVVALILTPLVLLYQGWTYYVFRARITGGDVAVPAAKPSPAASAVPPPTGGTPAA
jgi:cytochrome d ubiquinol oxidase subunit II